jgi:hypothetical protein
MPPYLERPEALLDDANEGTVLPYGMTARAVVRAINDVYAYLNALNRASIEHGYDRLEDLMQPAGFSGLLSNLFVRSVARECATMNPGLAMNQLGGGRPDLVPRAMYSGDSVLRGDEGIEVKVSRYGKGWQGHNPETGWIVIVQVGIDTSTSPVYDRSPTIVNRVLIGNLTIEDWTYSGRSETSRRTPTASINRGGYLKLAQGVIYSKRGALLTDSELTPLPNPAGTRPARSRRPR